MDVNKFSVEAISTWQKFVCFPPRDAMGRCKTRTARKTRNVVQTLLRPYLNMVYTLVIIHSPGI